MNPRIAPLAPPFPPAIDAALGKIMPPGAPPLALFAVLARNPRVFQRFMAGGLLDRGSIGLREREIVIDRATARCGAEYEWGVHVAFFAGKAGLGEAQVEATVHGAADDPAWSPREQLLLRLVDTLHETATVDDALWAALAAEFSDEQRIELVVLAGLYHMVSFVTNALALPMEPYAARFPQPR